MTSVDRYQVWVATKQELRSLVAHLETTRELFLQTTSDLRNRTYASSGGSPEPAMARRSARTRPNFHRSTRHVHDPTGDGAGVGSEDPSADTPAKLRIAALEEKLRDRRR